MMRACGAGRAIPFLDAPHESACGGNVSTSSFQEAGFLCHRSPVQSGKVHSFKKYPHAYVLCCVKVWDFPTNNPRFQMDSLFLPNDDD